MKDKDETRRFWPVKKQDLQRMIEKHGYFEFHCELLLYFFPVLFRISGVDLIPLIHAIWKMFLYLLAKQSKNYGVAALHNQKGDREAGGWICHGGGYDILFEDASLIYVYPKDWGLNAYPEDPRCPMVKSFLCSGEKQALNRFLDIFETFLKNLDFVQALNRASKNVEAKLASREMNPAHLDSMLMIYKRQISPWDGRSLT